MKKYKLVFLFLSMAICCDAQNWQTITSNRSPMFMYENSGFMRAIRIDSVFLAGTDSVFFNYRSVNDSVFDVTPYSWSPTCYTDSSWIGSSVIIKTNGDNIFVTETLDSVLIKSLSNLSDSWAMYRFANGDRLVATVTTEGIDTVLSVPDSTKEISLQFQDSMGNNLNGNINGHQFTISKSFGLIRTLAFRNFPSSLLRFDLIGMNGFSAGVQNLTAFEIYDYNIGDVLQYYIKYSTLNTLQIFNIQNTILGKSYSINNDSVTYTIDDSTLHEVQAMGSTFSFSHSIYNVTYLLQSPFDNTLNVLPHEVSITDSTGNNAFCEQSLNTNYNTRTYKSIFTDLTIDSPFLCGGYYFSSGNFWCWSVKYTYAKGLGMVLQENVNPYATRICIWNMNYFKKGVETWGTPFLFYQAVNLDEVEKNQLQITPNPTTGKLTISNLQQAINKIDVFNILGEKVMSFNLYTPNSPVPTEIDISSFPPGIYIVQAGDGQKVWHAKVVKE